MTFSRRLKLTIAFLLIPALLAAQGLPLKSGATSDLATVDTNKNLRVAQGASTRASYSVSMSAQATTAAILLSIEAAAGTGFKLAGFCWTTSNATAAAAVTVSVQRRTTASTGGTACTAEGTTVSGAGCDVSKMDPADGNYGGVARNGGTAGTAGAVLDQIGHQAGIVATGAGGTPPVCQWYSGGAGSAMKMPIVAAGTANGLTINVSAAGAGGIAAGAITAFIIAE